MLRTYRRKKDKKKTREIDLVFYIIPDFHENFVMYK